MRAAAGKGEGHSHRHTVKWTVQEKCNSDHSIELSHTRVEVCFFSFTCFITGVVSHLCRPKAVAFALILLFLRMHASACVSSSAMANCGSLFHEG